jgi:hypothetical protein
VPEAEPNSSPPKKRKRRLDWATLHQRTFATDVLRCPCGGRRRIQAVHATRTALTPHLHVLVPDALWRGEGEALLVPPPTDDEVTAVLARVLRQARRRLGEVRFGELLMTRTTESSQPTGVVNVSSTEISRSDTTAPRGAMPESGAGPSTVSPFRGTSRRVALPCANSSCRIRSNAQLIEPIASADRDAIHVRIMKDST